MNLIPLLSFLITFCIWFTNVQPSHGQGMGAVAMLLPPGCDDLYKDIQKKVKASSPKLNSWIKSECEKQCKDKAPMSEAIKYEDWGFTFVDKMNGWFKKQKPALDIYNLCPEAFDRQRMLMVAGEVKKVCLDSTPFGKKIKSHPKICHIKDEKEFDEFSKCVKKFIEDKVIPKIMAKPPMKCLPKLKPYCTKQGREAVIQWIGFWMDTTFAKKEGKLGDPNLPDPWNPYKTVHNFYANKCKAVASDTKNAAQIQFPPWSDK